jgi:hypothetical protein
MQGDGRKEAVCVVSKTVDGSGILCFVFRLLRGERSQNSDSFFYVHFDRLYELLRWTTGDPTTVARRLAADENWILNISAAIAWLPSALSPWLFSFFIIFLIHYMALNNVNAKINIEKIEKKNIVWFSYKRSTS